MAAWADESKKQKWKLVAELLGRLYAEAAVKKRAAEDKGEGFSIWQHELFPGDKDKAFQQIQYDLGVPDCTTVTESESLKEFSRLFGYSVKVEFQYFHYSRPQEQVAVFSPAFEQPVLSMSN